MERGVQNDTDECRSSSAQEHVQHKMAGHPDLELGHHHFCEVQEEFLAVGRGHDGNVCAVLPGMESSPAQPWEGAAEVARVALAGTGCCSSLAAFPGCSTQLIYLGGGN